MIIMKQSTTKRKENPDEKEVRKVVQNGSSLCITLPLSFAKKLRFKKGSHLLIEMVSDTDMNLKVVEEAVKAVKPKYAKK